MASKQASHGLLCSSQARNPKSDCRNCYNCYPPSQNTCVRGPEMLPWVLRDFRGLVRNPGNRRSVSQMYPTSRVGIHILPELRHSRKETATQYVTCPLVAQQA